MLAQIMNEINDTERDSGRQTADKNDIDSASKAQIVSLDSSVRKEPIHSLIMEVRLPSAGVNVDNITNVSSDPPTTLNPVTLRPFTIDELRAHKLESMLSQYPTQEAAAKAREDTAVELRKLIDDNERKNKEIDREMEEKEKTREIERKVYARKLGKDA